VPLFLSGKENQKSKTIVSITDYCHTRWHKFGGDWPTNNGDPHAWGWEDFTFHMVGLLPAAASDVPVDRPRPICLIHSLLAGQVTGWQWLL